MRLLTLLLRQAQHEDEQNQRAGLILSLSKDELARIIMTFSATR
jgi:hypothetical protein